MDPGLRQAVNDRLNHLRALERELRHGAMLGPVVARADDDGTWRGLIRLAFTGWIQDLNGFVRHQLPDGIAAVVSSVEAWANDLEAADLVELAGAELWRDPSDGPRPVGWTMPRPPPYRMDLHGAQGEIWIDPDRLEALATMLGQVADGIFGFSRMVGDALEPLRLPPGPPYASPATRGSGGMPVDAAAAVGWPTAYQGVSEELRAALVDLIDRAAKVRRANAVIGGMGPELPVGVGAATGGLSQAASDADRAAGEFADLEKGPGHQSEQAKEADPVSVSTGNYLLETLDVVITGGPGGGLLFGRAYNSLGAAREAGLGFGWSHSFDIVLTPGPSGIALHHSDGPHELIPSGDPRVRRAGDGFEFNLPSRTVWRFDGDGRLREVADRSANRWQLRYTEAGRLAEVEDPAGRPLRFDGDDAGRITAVTDVLGRTWRYEYDDAGDLVAAADPAGARWAYAYDGAHHLTSVTDPDGGLVIENAYDRSGRVVDQFDSAGAHWSYEYRPGRTVVIDPLDRERCYGVDDRFRTTSFTDPAGTTTRFSWDDGSHLVAVADGADRTWRFSYDERGHLTRAAGPDESTVAYEYDEAENLVAVVGADAARLRLAYDDAGRPVALTTPSGATTTVAWRPDGLATSVTDPVGGTSRYEYDEAGALTALVDPLGAVTRVSFDAAGQVLGEVHPDGARTSFEWDAAGRLVGVTDAFGARWRYGYDGSGRLTAVTDALGRTTRYAWDARGLLVSVTDPRGRATTFEHDLARRLVGKTDARGVRVSFTWDATDRLTAVEPVDGPASRFGYDATGRLVSMSDATGATRFTHDAADRPVREQRELDGTALVHDYDRLGRRVRLRLERDGRHVAAWAYDYDTESRVAAVVNPAGGRTALTCDPAGQLVEVAHPNGVVSRYSHDAAGQLVELVHAAAGGEPFATWSFTYDESGNRMSAGPVRYGYDQLDRLTSVTVDGAPALDAHFAYDPLGNRTAAGDRTFTYDEADQVISDGIYSYEHDAVGNLVARRPLAGGPGELVCAWDGLGRLLSLTADGTTTSFGYDALGRHTVRRDPTGETVRLFDGANVLEERRADGTGTWETAAGLLVLHRIRSDGRFEYLHPDGNANVAWLTDAAGAARAGPPLGPWGEPLDGTSANGGPPGGPGTAADGVVGFAGTVGVRGEVAGLWDMRARFYDPHLGRFISRDPWPATLPGPATLNRYAYALNDPICLLDPSGLFCWTGKNKEGKCRGLHDVAERVAKPLETISTIATAVSVVSTGLTVVCPPCGVVTIPLAGAMRITALGTGVFSTLSECAASGSVTSFNCIKGVAGEAIGALAGGPIEARLGSLAENSTLKIAGNAIVGERVGKFGEQIFELFMHGTSAAISEVRK